MNVDEEFPTTLYVLRQDVGFIATDDYHKLVTNPHVEIKIGVYHFVEEKLLSNDTTLE